MGLYTSIYFTPVDRTWTAPPEVILRIASLLGVTMFDDIVIYREASTDPTLLDHERFEETMRKQKFPINGGISQLPHEGHHWSFLMFPSSEFIHQLLEELKSAIPDSLSGGLVPWCTSIYWGHWATYSYDEGTQNDGGNCCFTLSGDGCPTSMEEYLDRFLSLPAVRQLKQRLEELSHQKWTAIINLT
jgi:hypothetical protein